MSNIINILTCFHFDILNYFVFIAEIVNLYLTLAEDQV